MDYGVYVDMVVCDGENCLDLLRNIVIVCYCVYMGVMIY